jgi:DNA-binding CsgD family transcriptional regulator
MYANPEELFGGSRKFLSLIELIYSAVDDATRWPLVLERVSEAIRGRETVMFANFTEPTATDICSLARMDPTVLTPYVDYYAQVNVLAKRCDELFADGTARYAHRAVPDAEFEKTEFYNDYFHPHGMHYSMGIKIPMAGQAPGYLTCMRPKRDGAFDDAEGAALETLLPHLQRAMALHLQLSQLKANAAAMGSALDAFGHAVFGLNGNGGVVASNSSAEELVRKGDGLRLREGRLVAEDAQEDSQLQSMVDSATHSTESKIQSNGPRSMRLSRRFSLPLSLVILPFLSCPVPDYGQLEALAVVSAPDERHSSRVDLLRNLYRLTPTEARMADLIAQGKEIKDAALMMGTTLETGRFHVKRVLAKTGTRRQAELVKLVLSLPGTSPV